MLYTSIFVFPSLISQFTSLSKYLPLFLTCIVFVQFIVFMHAVWSLFTQNVPSAFLVCENLGISTLCLHSQWCGPSRTGAGHHGCQWCWKNDSVERTDLPLVAQHPGERPASCQRHSRQLQRPGQFVGLCAAGWPVHRHADSERTPHLPGTYSRHSRWQGGLE